MTEMAYGSVGTVEGEAVLSRWWRTLDKSVLTAILILFSIGLLLGLASSPPLAEKNGLAPFHYVYRQAIFRFSCAVCYDCFFHAAIQSH
ncbi:MAG: hypothetical protein CM15mP54_11700 [Paracoccaceae bacterium]|nr:MAG: hypothetical protein CM15mP54_11700 [Paracoccaceae bacterium]